MNSFNFSAHSEHEVCILLQARLTVLHSKTNAHRSEISYSGVNCSLNYRESSPDLLTLGYY